MIEVSAVDDNGADDISSVEPTPLTDSVGNGASSNLTSSLPVVMIYNDTMQVMACMRCRCIVFEVHHTRQFIYRGSLFHSALHPGDYHLRVNATDNSTNRNSNTSVAIDYNHPDF